MNRPSLKAEVMSKSALKQELPPLEPNEEELESADTFWPSANDNSLVRYYFATTKCRERQLSEALAESAALREEIAKLTLLSDSQLSNQERLVGEMQELRQKLENSSK
jgi:hypothetical protein